MFRQFYRGNINSTLMKNPPRLGENGTPCVIAARTIRVKNEKGKPRVLKKINF